MINSWTSYTFTPIDDTFNFSTPVGTATTAWGPATKLFSQQVSAGSIAIYCVGCGVAGNIDVQVTLTFSLFEGITSGSISADGPIVAAVQLGVVATLEQSWDYEQEIASLPLSTFAIPGVLTIGPEITLSAGGNLTVAAEGGLLAGVLLNWTDIS
ncbi:hypothetical protein OIDMADRAFT_137724, partial [Oidiodendron maius Zn]